MLKYKRLLEFNAAQLQQAYTRIEKQEDDLTKIEEELVQAYRNFDILSIKKGSENLPQISERTPNVKAFNTQETQTSEVLCEKENTAFYHSRADNLQKQLLELNSEITIKNKALDHLKSKLTEMEINLNSMKNQLQDKQSQIVFYEKHIVELQSKTDRVNANVSPFAQSNEDIVALKVNT